MAFKMTYSFEGNYRSRPEQNLSGASKENTRDVLLQRAHEERQKRHDERIKFQSTLTLQSYIRGYLTRQCVKQQERLLFDQENKQNIGLRLSRLLFFYSTKEDKDRFFLMCESLLKNKMEIIGMMSHNQFSWLIKRFLVLCLNSLEKVENPEILFMCLIEFSVPNNIGYLNSKGYFRKLRSMLDDNKSPQLHSESILKLLIKPFEYYNLTDEKNLILSEFCSGFLSPDLSSFIRTNIISYLAKLSIIPYDDLITYLNQCNTYFTTDSLLFCILSLEPKNYSQSKKSINVLSNMSVNLCKNYGPLQDLTEDSDLDEPMDCTRDHIVLEDFLVLFNNPVRAKKILCYFMEHTDDEELLISLSNICHNLLMVYSENSIRKFMILYMLALRGVFLEKLWSAINVRTSAIKNRGMLSSWNETYMLTSVFCSMFTFYTQTLTDSESTDTSSTFSLEELSLMSDVLKSFALNLIEIAFPMCRYNMITSTPEMVQLYHNCVRAVKMLNTLDLRKKFCATDFWTKKKIHVQPDLLRKNYLEKELIPFHGLVLTAEDYLPPLSTIELRSLAVIKELPFLLDFNTRVILLRDLCFYSTGGHDRFVQEFHADNVVVIRRSHIYEDAFEKISQKNDSVMKQRLRIQFINNVGLEEAGIDGGGIFKEFINEVLKTAFDPNRGFFLLTADNTLYPNPNVHLLIENYRDHYYFIGRLVGKAVFENILVDLPLAEFFLAKLLVDKASAHFLQSLDPILYRNLLYLRDYTGDVQDLGLDFTLVNNDLGETRVVELKPGGRNIAVTNDNRLEYIHKLADLKLNTQISQQCAAFREGLDSVVPILWLRLFNYYELQVIISGDNQEIDVEDLKNNTAYGGDFTSEHPTIIMFWKIVDRFTETQKKQLLKFVTSCSRPPLLGFKELTPSFCIQSSGSEDRMPTASTCLNLLKIPLIKDEAILKKKLLQAIEQQAGFELS
ncbi:ubiquitin-protein ligase E3C [Onthophagus taurus]|uniref:ubiquitin-protein ligase E3C n=1 Tax=Onthophagus taurus TaxID=166361 RepID=UPI000C2099DE|nr:ubiquitin-protein ligase E3C [Onthophagus taurus]